MTVPPICDTLPSGWAGPLTRLPVEVPVPAGAAAVLVGSIAEAGSGRALQGAQLEVWSDTDGRAEPAGRRWRAIADSLGGFVLAGVPAGRYALIAKKISYYAYRDTITLQAGATDTLRVALRYYSCSGY